MTLDARCRTCGAPDGCHYYACASIPPPESVPQPDRPNKQPERKSAKNARISALEQKIVSQRKHISRLEECRKFERETEQGLAAALRDIYRHETDFRTGPTVSLARAAEALVWYTERLGPRQEAN